MNDIEKWAEQCMAGLDVAFPLPQNKARINDLSIEYAIREHVQWFHEWKNSLNSTDEKFDPTIVCQDNKCQLGHWIYGLNTSLTNTFEYQNLKLTHAQFHRLAADIIRESRYGDKSLTDKSQQKLLESSRQIVAALIDLEAINQL